MQVFPVVLEQLIQEIGLKARKILNEEEEKVLGKPVIQHFYFEK